jgi:hypothetical protein
MSRKRIHKSSRAEEFCDLLGEVGTHLEWHHIKGCGLLTPRLAVPLKTTFLNIAGFVILLFVVLASIRQFRRANRNTS